MGRGTWQATVHGVTESDTTERFHFLTAKKTNWSESTPEALEAEPSQAATVGDAEPPGTLMRVFTGIQLSSPSVNLK